MASVSDLVRAESFFNHSNRLIYGALEGLVTEGKSADIVTVFERLREHHATEDFGGLAYLNALFQSVISARNARLYAEIVAERSAERVLIAGLSDATRISWESGAPLADRMERIGEVMRRIEEQRLAPVKAQLPLLSTGELRDVSMSARWLINGILPAEAIGMLFGASGTFKSFLALDAALHVAHGLPWMGCKTVKGSVLYIAAEGGANLWPRIEAWHLLRNLDWNGIDLKVVPVALDLAVNAWRVVEVVTAAAMVPLLVVVDTVSQTFAGDENSATEVAAYLREIDSRFRALWHCSVLLIHHTGHLATERPRGSSALRANLDFMIGAFRDEKEMLATLVCSKQKDAEQFSDASFKLTRTSLGLDDQGDERTSLVAWHLSGDDEIQNAIDDEAKAGRGGRDHLLLSLAQNGMSEKELRKIFSDATGLIESEARKKAYFRARKHALDGHKFEIVDGTLVFPGKLV